MTAHAVFGGRSGRIPLRVLIERCDLMTGHRSGGGRHRGHAFGAGFGGPGFFGRGPRAGRGDVRSAILALLAEQPMHGYQIMSELTERSGGAWRPSPGSIYPTLQLLQDEALVRGEEVDGGKRLFQLTDTGREAAAELGGRAPWETVGDEGDDSIRELRDLVFGVMGATRQVVHTGDADQLGRAREVLRDARRRLYRILADESGDQGETPTD
jgi:DNA-binding PadR family transcriptional regulator